MPFKKYQSLADSWARNKRLSRGYVDSGGRHFWTTGRLDPRDYSAIRLASMAHSDDFDRGLVPVIEEDTVVTTTKTEADFRPLEFLHITGAVG